MLDELNRRFARLTMDEGARLRLYRKIAKMLTNGLPLLRILEEMHFRAAHQGKKPNEPLALMLDDCRRMVQNGRLLSEGLAWWIPRTEQMIIMAGEQSGRLEITLLGLVDVVQAQKKIKGVIVGGLAYPAAIMAMIVGYLYVFGTRVIPQFARVIDPTSWKGAARSLYLMSQVVEHWTPLVLGGLALAVAGVLASMPRWCGRVRNVVDRFAPYSIYRLLTGSGFLMAFSSLQFAGITVEKSLLRLSANADPWLRERLDGAMLGIKSGLNCGEALRNAGYDFPSREVVEDLCVYAEFKGFPEALKMLADEWMEDGVATVAAQMKVLNGISMALMAAVVSWLVTGFFGIQNEIANMTRAIH